MGPEMLEKTPSEPLSDPQPETVFPEPPLPEEPVLEPEQPLSPEPPLPSLEDVTQRLATEFVALAEEFPHLVSPTELPDSVLDTAAKEGIPLLDAYLRYRWQEEKKVATANATRRRAAASSAGSLSRGAVETPPEQDAFMRAFRSAL